MLTSTPKINDTTNYLKPWSIKLEIRSSYMFGIPYFYVTEVENLQLCVDSSSADSDAVIS